MFWRKIFIWLWDFYPALLYFIYLKIFGTFLCYILFMLACYRSVVKVSVVSAVFVVYYAIRSFSRGFSFYDSKNSTLNK